MNTEQSIPNHIWFLELTNSKWFFQIFLPFIFHRTMRWSADFRFGTTWWAISSVPSRFDSCARYLECILHIQPCKEHRLTWPRINSFEEEKNFLQREEKNSTIHLTKCVACHKRTTPLSLYELRRKNKRCQRFCSWHYMEIFDMHFAGFRQKRERW